ncbi:NAD(P)/FAD-dependent oxidoreductase [Pseudonocardia spinosispora]|uniref:NAD(P)/FAD-dependent oxidoreductase n=1 Tax=Pseudonocardia spinosispora TaxID=103441 RepID=UPI0003F4E1E8|nr:FAD-dependent oxidoreductase [Pseudonocardia spinosispora]
MSTSLDRTHVVLLGAGYASIWAYRALTRRLPRRVRITVVEPQPMHVFHGWTGEVLSAELPPDAQFSPVSEALPKAEHVRGWARGVDRETRTVTVELVDGGQAHLHYDHLVVGIGAVEELDSVPGLREHAFSLREAGRTATLSAHLDECIAEAAAVEASEERARLLHVVLAGAGLAGIEASVAVAQRLAKAGANGAKVTLVGSSTTLALELSPTLRDRVTEELARNDVRVVAPARVAAVTPDGVKLDDGSWLPSATTIASVGNRAHPLAGLTDLATDAAGRLRTDEYLRIEPRIWAGGDAACVRTSVGGVCPKDAGWAIGQGSWLGRNIARTILGRPPKRFTWMSAGVTAGFGAGHAVLDTWGMPVRGRPAWLSRAAFFAFYLPSRRQLLRVLWLLARRRLSRS